MLLLLARGFLQKILNEFPSAALRETSSQARVRAAVAVSLTLLESHVLFLQRAARWERDFVLLAPGEQLVEQAVAGFGLGLGEVFGFGEVGCGVVELDFSIEEELDEFPIAVADDGAGRVFVAAGDVPEEGAAFCFGFAVKDGGEALAVEGGGVVINSG